MTQFTDDNRRYFDDLANKYDVQPWQRDMSSKITAFLQEPEQLAFIDADRLPSHDGPVRLLDYACGTGMVSRAFGPFVSHIDALDLSPNMVARYKELASSSEVNSVRHATARVGNLLTEAEPASALDGEDLHGFDIAAIALGVHHFADPALAIERLAGRLKESGVLLIVDFVEEHGIRLPSASSHTVHKHGFEEKEMKALMESSNLVQYGWREMPGKVELKMHEGAPIARRVFLARGTRRS